MAATVTELLAERADDDGTAILHDTGTWTWREYLADARRVAAVVPTPPIRRGPCTSAYCSRTPDDADRDRRGRRGRVRHGRHQQHATGDGLARDIRRADCQVLLIDAEHRDLLDGLDLGDCRVRHLQRRVGRASRQCARTRAPLDAGGRRSVHADLHVGDQR